MSSRNNFCRVFFAILLFPSAFGYFYHNTSLGVIKGTTMLSRGNSKFYAFLGLPYAVPPVGELRFQNPILYTEPWKDVYDATKQSAMCLQSVSHGFVFGTEDCLYLNLYTPQSPHNMTKKLPVWFFIYPGRRLFGDPGTDHWGPHYIMDYPIILIIASYRVGALGFLSTEDEVISGNFGLKDQAMVLSWINRYIAEFGGDPNNVVMSGESSGAIDVSFHTFSPLSRDFFHKSISHSGHALNHRAVTEPGKARAQAWKLAKMLGCYNPFIKTTETLLQCFRFIPGQFFVSILPFFSHDYVLPHTYFGAVIERADLDGAFLVSHPILDIDKPNNKTWMLGIVTEEARQKSIGFYDFPNREKKKAAKAHFLAHYKRLIPYVLSFDYAPNKQKILDSVLEHFLDDVPLEDAFYEFSNAFGSGTVQLGMIETALQYNGPKYFFHYDYLNEYSFGLVYRKVFKLYTKYEFGVAHGEDLLSLFPMRYLFPLTISGNDRIVSDQMLQLFCNFITYGNPNGKKGKQLWKPVTTPEIDYLYIGNLTLTPKTKPAWGAYQFWKNIGNPPLMTRERLTTLINEYESIPQYEKLKTKYKLY